MFSIKSYCKVNKLPPRQNKLKKALQIKLKILIKFKSLIPEVITFE
jgi:hypothetical protein